MPASFDTVLLAVFSTVTQVVGTIVESPLLLIPVGVGFAGAAIGLAKRLMGTGRRRR